MIERRYSQLDGVGHGHLVGFQKQIVREPGLGIEIQHSVDAVVSARSLEMLLEPGRRRVWICRSQEFACVQSIAPAAENAKRAGGTAVIIRLEGHLQQRRK